jgi:fatty acid desaturase
MQRIENLFAREGVQFSRDQLSIKSTETPLAILGIQRRLYSRRNWVGLNPFAFVSGVEVRCESGESRVVRIGVHIDQFRTFIWVAFWAACSGFAAVAMPEWGWAILFIATVTVGAWFVLVWFLGGFLIKKEIRDCLIAPCP